MILSTIPKTSYAVVVVGGGHAGAEAALAAARMGVKTLLVTMEISAIALAPCNPAIGGPAKSIVVREVDAMGGAMGEITDQSQILMDGDQAVVIDRNTAALLTAMLQSVQRRVSTAGYMVGSVGIVDTENTTFFMDIVEQIFSPHQYSSQGICFTKDYSPIRRLMIS